MYVHSSRFLRQFEHMRFRGIDPSPLYSIAGIGKEEISDPEKMFSFEQFHLVLEYAIEKSGDEYYGLRMGNEPHIAGTVGMMCASCRNLKEAFEQGCLAFNIQGNFADISFHDDPVFPYIEYRITNAWKLRYPETARHEVDAMFAFLSIIMKVNSNNSLLAHRVELIREKPVSTEEYEEILGRKPEFAKEENRMIFRASDLLIPMKAFNPETFMLLKSHLEKQLKKFENRESIAEKVRSILLSSLKYQFPDMEEVASRLNTSTRTLQRQLSNEKTSFKDILQSTRFELAKEMLGQGGLTVSEISYALGYSDPGNFSRSFRNYTGMSPAGFRESVKP